MKQIASGESAQTIQGLAMYETLICRTQMELPTQGQRACPRLLQALHAEFEAKFSQPEER
jgi:hypothetical protein